MVVRPSLLALRAKTRRVAPLRQNRFRARRRSPPQITVVAWRTPPRRALYPQPVLRPGHRAPRATAAWPGSNARRSDRHSLLPLLSVKANFLGERLELRQAQ